MNTFSPDKAEAIRILSRKGWLAGRRPDVRATIAGMLRLRHFEEGQSLYHVGDAPNGLFGLVHGGLDLSLPRSDGQQLTVHRSDAGYWIGDLAALANQTRLVTVRVARPSVLVHASVNDLRRLLDEQPRYYEDFYALSHENMALALRLLATMTVTSSEVRVAMRLLEYDELASESEGWVKLSQSMLAEMVAVSRPTLQRVMRRLQDDGLVELGYGRMRVRDKRGLLALCNADLPPMSRPVPDHGVRRNELRAARDPKPS